MEDNSHEQHWTEWFRQHGSKLLLCARHWTRSAADAEDVLQDAFVRFWRTQRSLGSSDPIGLVLTSVRRAALDLARRDQRRLQRENAADDGAANEALFEPLAENDDRRVALESALQRLPREQREVLVMKIWGERTFEQIAQELGVSANTAASRYRYALAAMRKELHATTLT